MFLAKVSILTITVLFLAASGPSAPARARAPLQSCTGCLPSGGSSSSSTGTEPGFVSVETTLTKGKCKFVLTNEDWILACIQFKGCTAATSSSWAGLEPGSQLDLCIREAGDVLRCESPTRTVAADGAGLVLDLESIPCEPETEGTVVFSIVAQSGGLSASAAVSCSPCAGS